VADMLWREGCVLGSYQMSRTHPALPRYTGFSVLTLDSGFAFIFSAWLTRGMCSGFPAIVLGTHADTKRTVL
jgi:hypothetical protein